MTVRIVAFSLVGLILVVFLVPAVFSDFEFTSCHSHTRIEMLFIESIIFSELKWLVFSLACSESPALLPTFRLVSSR